jgi:hypothetical protein
VPICAGSRSTERHCRRGSGSSVTSFAGLAIGSDHTKRPITAASRGTARAEMTDEEARQQVECLPGFFLSNCSRQVGVTARCLHIRGAGCAGERQTGWQSQPLPLVALIRAVRLVMPSPKVGIVNHSAHANCTFLDDAFHRRLRRCSFICFGSVMPTVRSQLT